MTSVPCKKTENKILQIYLICMLIVFPLYMPTGYYLLGNNKYIFFRAATLAVIGASFLCHMLWPAFRSRLNALDFVVLGFAAVSTVSFLTSEFLKGGYALMGADGWFMGYFTQMLLTGLYFAVSRCCHTRVIAAWSAVIGATVSSFFIILNRFGIDPLGVYTGLEDKYILMFVGTLGQTSWCAGYLSVLLPFAMGIYIVMEDLECETTRKKNEDPTPVEWLKIVTHDKWVRYLLIAALSVIFAACVLQNSDSVFLSLTVSFAIIFLLGLKNRNIRIRAIELFLIMMISTRIVGVFRNLFRGRIPELDPISEMVTSHAAGWIFLAAAVALFVFRKKITDKVFGIVLLSGVIAAVATVVLAVIAGLVPEEYLVFDERWGNSRGYIWNFMLKVYSECTIPQKIFGVGPGCTLYRVMLYYSNDIHAYWDDVYLANAHNEFLTMLIDEGIVGFLSYLGIFVLGIVEAAKNRKKSAFNTVLLLCIVSYIANNSVGYQQVENTPYIFIILGAVRRCDTGDGSH